MIESLAPSPAPFETWPTIVAGDYDFGVVRLATLVKAGTNHLLFASVELLPAEMSPPPEDGTFQNFGSARLIVGRSVLPLVDALAWYASLLEGAGRIPGQAFAIAPDSLGAEPPLGRFTLPSTPLPFAPHWHGRPRLHRLVPMAALADPVALLRDTSATVAASIRARAWLQDQLHFDLLGYDAWLGAAVLIAPNPLLRNCSLALGDRDGVGETVELRGAPRRGVDLSTLRFTIEEFRAGAAGWRLDGSPDALGRLCGTAPSQVPSARHEIVCARRGLLDQDDPGWFMRGVWSQSATAVKRRIVQPPKRAAASAPLVISLRDKNAGPPAPPLTPLRQVEHLQDLQGERTGGLLPAERADEPRTSHILENDRARAVDHIRRLIGHARDRILFVDPYFDAEDLQEFAMAAQFEGVAIQALVNPRPGNAKKESNEKDELNGSESIGDALLRQIAAMRDPAQGFGVIDIRVSTGRRSHDRFLQIDDAVWHCGHSFNQIGQGELSLMTQVAKPAEIRAILADVFAEATPFEHWWAQRQRATEARPADASVRALGEQP